MSAKLPYKGDLTCAMQCRDLGATIKWYESVLGFSLLYRVDEISWAEMSTPIAGVAVGFAQQESPEVRGGATLTWGVTDIDAARATLEKQKVKFDGPTMTIEGLVKLAVFFDPDGNKFMLSQSLQ